MDKMKKLTIVQLINEKPYLSNNLEKNMRGIAIEETLREFSVMFFNPKNLGDFAIVNVSKEDLVIENETIPAKLQNELLANLDSITKKAKNKIHMPAFDDYDRVELLVKDAKYSQYGVRKGDKGVVVDNNVIENCVEVDFLTIDDNGTYLGDCISVNIDDIKKI